jgi:hypothetical protein
MSTDALEVALALHQAPIQRFAVRDRPLPKNIGIAIQIASATQPQLEEAAAKFSETEETILAAVRFYLQQVLFEPGTDAYRIFGLADNASAQQIRQHHVWLQRWLHPDRRGENWEAALATKVNWAWQQLRNEASREEYERTRKHDSARAHQAAEPAGDEQMQVPVWNAAPVKPARRYLRWLAMGVALVSCMVLFYLAATRQDRVDPNALALQPRRTDSAIRPILPFFVATADPVQEPLKTAPVASNAVAPSDNAVPGPTETIASSQSANQAHVARISGPDRIDTDQAAGINAESRTDSKTPIGGLVASNAPASMPEAISLPAQNASAGHRLSPAKEALATATLAKTEVPQQQSRMVADVKSEPSELAAQRPSTPFAASESQSVDSVKSAHSTGAGVADQRFIAENAAATAPPKQNPKAKPTAPIERVSTTANNASKSRVQGNEFPAHAAEPVESIEPNQSDTDKLASESIGLASNENSATPSNEDSPQPAGQLDREALERFEAARERVRSMVNYFRSQNAAMPRWNDDHGQRTAERERIALHARNSQAAIEHFALEPPTWRITSTAATLEATYHVDARQAATEYGRINLDMAWQDGGWKITRMKVSPAR